MAGEGEVEESDFLRQELHDSIKRYSTMTVYQVIGVLDAVKMDMWDMLEKKHTRDDSENAD